MGGSVNVLIRFSNNEKKAFRIHTSDLKKFEDPIFLDETRFREQILSQYYKGEPVNKSEHDDYYSKKTYFSPYAYGALFFDLKEKKVFSSNNYSGFLNILCLSLIPYLTKLVSSSKKMGISLYDQEEILEGFNDDNSEIVVLERNKIFESPSRFYTDFYLINYALKNNWTVKVNDNIIEHNGDFIHFMNTILGKDIIADTVNSFDGLDWELIPELSSNIENSIDLIPEGWEFIQGDGSPAYVNVLYEYMLKNKIISDEEVVYWNEYLTQYN